MNQFTTKSYSVKSPAVSGSSACAFAKGSVLISESKIWVLPGFENGAADPWWQSGHEQSHIVTEDGSTGRTVEDPVTVRFAALRHSEPAAFVKGNVW